MNVVITGYFITLFLWTIFPSSSSEEKKQVCLAIEFVVCVTGLASPVKFKLHMVLQKAINKLYGIPMHDHCPACLETF